MMTIDCCPRCDREFLYHSSDHHLIRHHINDIFEPIVICQECNEAESQLPNAESCTYLGVNKIIDNHIHTFKKRKVYDFVYWEFVGKVKVY